TLHSHNKPGGNVFNYNDIYEEFCSSLERARDEGFECWKVNIWGNKKQYHTIQLEIDEMNTPSPDRIIFIPYDNYKAQPWGLPPFKTQEVQKIQVLIIDKK